MKLTIAAPYAPIRHLPAIEFPQFTLITGYNGAGKSRLLTGIREGKIKTIPEFTQNEVVLFTQLTLSSGDGGNYNSGAIGSELENARREHTRGVNDALLQLNSYVLQYQETANIVDNAKAIVTMTIQDFTQSGLAIERAKNLHKRIQDLVLTFGGEVLSPPMPPIVRQAHPVVRKIAKRLGKPAILVNENDISLDDLSDFQSATLFEQKLAQIFVLHMEIDKVRRLRKYANEEPDKKEIGIESPAPWHLINKVFKEASIPYTINKPDDIEPLPFYPALTKNGSSDRIELSQLSSGEKILVALALSIYQVSSSRELLQFPKLLLFDELDAVLHPSMIRYYLQIISDTFVAELGMHVIATTHSPTTVALAPEVSLFVMNDGSSPSLERIRKTSKSDALNILTVGVPTIAINFDNRRQVFVEDEIDAKLYQSIYDRIKSTIESERTLSFLAVGSTMKSKMGQQHPVATGCSVVKDMVERLTVSGNKSVWGLVDWDSGQNVPKGRLEVFAQDRRYSIESALLDPRILIAVFHMDPDLRKILPDFGLDHETSIQEFQQIAPEIFQVAIYQLTKRVVKSCDPTESISIEYDDDIQFNIPKAYLHHNGHQLEDLLRIEFPALKRYDRDGGLKLYIVGTIFREFPFIIPQDFIRCFKKILGDASH